jgi:hypothetical protein
MAARVIRMTWPSLDASASIQLLDDRAPTICNLLWDALPWESVQGHALISGFMMFATSPVFTLARENVRLFTQMGPGDCAYGPGSQNVVVAYGPLTEPEGISVWGHVPREHWPTLRRVGQRAWQNLMAPYGDLTLNPLAKQIILVRYEKA